MLDALSFALFGKAHRNISKPQLVNSINKKHTVVEVEFKVAGAEFKVVRGIKPAKFEIWKGDVLLNQSSHAKEYQKILEQNIIKLNHKSFHQIVVLGSSSFIPFMQLTTGARRDVIEDLLDINVFSKMNTILKEKTSLLKDQIKDITYQLEIQNNKIETHKKYIRDITSINSEQRESKDNQIKEAREEIEELNSQNSELSSKISVSSKSAKQSLQKHRTRRDQLNEYDVKFKVDQKRVVGEVQFFEKNDDCPTCKRSIDDAFKEAQRKKAASRAKALQKGMTQLNEQLVLVEQDLSNAQKQMDKLNEFQSEQNSNNKTIQRLHKNIDSVTAEIVKLSSSQSDLSKSKIELEDYVDIKNNLIEEKLKQNEKLSYNIVITEMLKDTGIKTKIVKQYLPVINQLVNQYLQVLDFFVSFNLDEAFKETIKSRHRDDFSYDSFSEGEKQRIDLALLFTWRMIAKMKNSVATNLLVLDETFDSSLDHDGVDNLMKILYTLGDDTNIFVISHKGEILEGKFKKKIEFIKDKNFSKIKGK